MKQEKSRYATMPDEPQLVSSMSLTQNVAHLFSADVGATNRLQYEYDIGGTRVSKAGRWVYASAVGLR